MTKNSKFSMLRAGAAPFAIGLALLSTPVFAQEEPQEAAATEDEIVVTGTRITGVAIDSVSPVQVIGSEQIAQSGVTNIQQLLLENPAFGTPGLSRTNSAFLTSGTGVATVDLRDLGSDRTLVLINGRRVVAGLPGTATVDLNVIPTQFLERVDVLTGGASSLYGSDAIAGVVNFVYKRDFEGLIADGQYGITQRGDDRRYQANLTFGGNFGSDDRGNIMVHLGYSSEGGVLSRNRANTFTDDLDTFANITGDPADYGVAAAPRFSSFVPQGRFDVNGSAGTGDDFTYDPVTGALRPCFSSNGGNAPAACGLPAGTRIGPDGFNRQAFRTIAVPVERYLFAARGHYDVTDAISFYAEGTYSKTRSSREIEPFALDVANIFPDTGRAPIETLVNGVPVLNPLVPAAIAAVAQDIDGDGLRDIGFARRLAEVGTRNGSTTRDFYRFVVGLEGNVTDNIRWDVSYTYGNTSESQRSNGQVNVLNFANALAAIPDVNDVNNNGLTTDAVCASATARAQGCVPINIFGLGSITPEALQYINAPQSFQTDISQQVVTGSLSGSVVELPAGPLAFFIGAEYRKERSVENNDALTNAGLNAGNAIPDTQGSFDVKEIFGELNIPILHDKPFFYDLSLRGAGRISDYSTVGTVYSYSGGVEWAPIEAIRFRGTYARAVRAPNIGELFTGPSQTFPSGLQDPCVGIGLTGGGITGDQCRSEPGVLANINDPANGGVFTQTQADLQGISGFNSGNPLLSEEKSDSYTAGVTIAPGSLVPALSGMNLSVDYFNIQIDDAIVAAPRTFILNQCYQFGDQQFCDLIQRRAMVTGSNSAGSLEFVNAPLVNGGSLKGEGIDVVASYTTSLDRLGVDGRLNARIAYTRYLDGFVVPVPGAPQDPFSGEIGTSKDRFTATLGYAGDVFDINFTGTYIGSAREDDQFLAQFDLPPDAINIPAEFYLDMQASWSPKEHFEFYFGVDNLLDNSAPNILSGTPFNITGTDTAADVYDPFGRRFYAGIRLNF